RGTFAEPVELGKRDRRRGGGRAGVVDEKIEPAERVNRAACHRLRLARRRYVSGRANDLVAESFQTLDLLHATRVVGEMVQRHGRAAAGESLDRSEPDPRSAARNERGFAG